MCKCKGYLNANNCSQFYVTTNAPLTFLDNQHFMAIGRVISGMRAFKLIDKLQIVNEKPSAGVKIVGSGEYKV